MLLKKGAELFHTTSDAFSATSRLVNLRPDFLLKTSDILIINKRNIYAKFVLYGVFCYIYCTKSGYFVQENAFSYSKFWSLED